MEKNPLLQKISRLLPSSLASCQFRTLSDVADQHPNDLSSSSSSSSLHSSSTVNPYPPPHVKGRKCPPASTLAGHRRKATAFHGGWSFSTTEDDEETRPEESESDRVLKKTWRSSDPVSTQLYYCSRRRGRSNESWYAVEKTTMDPRGAFRASMVEMIVEKQMLGPAELERLLLRFLALNTDSYHGMIFQVFSEICETLFHNY